MNKTLAKSIINNPHKLGHYFGYNLLSEIHSKWIRDCWFNPEDNSLQAHRGSYKTTSIMVVGSIWWLFFHFDDRIAIVRKDFTAASEVLQVISSILKSEKCHVLFKEIYGFDYEVIEDTQSGLTWSLKKTATVQGNVSAYGMGQDMTGKHFDRMLLDDVITIRDRLSKTEREKTKIYIQDIRANVIDPGKPIIFSGTPWHKADAWTILPPPKQYNIYTAGIEKFTDKYIKYLRSITTSSMFAANYELRHVASDDAFLPEPTYCKFDYSLNTVGHIDAKYSGNHTGAFTMMSKKPDGRVQATGFLFTRHINEEYENIKKLWLKYRCGTVHLESNADKGYAARDLQAIGVLTRSYAEHENKFVKIVQNVKPNWSKIDWDEDTDPEFLNQVMDFQEGQEPDDAIDSISSLIRESGIFRTVGGGVSVGEYEDNYKE
jgi:hypothetical protein